MIESISNLVTLSNLHLFIRVATHSADLSMQKKKKKEEGGVNVSIGPHISDVPTTVSISTGSAYGEIKKRGKCNPDEAGGRCVYTTFGVKGKRRRAKKERNM